MSKPKHCPNCGAAHVSAVAFERTYPNVRGETGYDCYCAQCEWSGDIMPDDE